MANTYTDTLKTNFIINKMTKAQYASITPNEDELYIITDDAAQGGLTIDNALSSSSTNPVQNQVIKSAIDSKISTTAVDGTTISYTNNALTCNGVKTSQGSVMTVWVGTQAQYDTAWGAGQIPATMLCIITDA